MKNLLLLAVLTVGCSCQHKVCDQEKRERLYLECLDRTTKNITSVGEDVDFSGAIWRCQYSADELSCWLEDDKMWWNK